MTDLISKFDFDKVIDIKYIHYIPGDIKAGKNQRQLSCLYIIRKINENNCSNSAGKAI